MIVVDASVLANAVGDDGVAGRAARDLLRRSNEIAAPDLVDAETTSVFRRRWLAGAITAERFADAVDDLAAFPVSRFATSTFMRRAFELRANVTTYDSCYVTLAEALECPLWTSDARLARASGPHCAVEVLTTA